MLSSNSCSADMVFAIGKLRCIQELSDGQMAGDWVGSVKKYSKSSAEDDRFGRSGSATVLSGPSTVQL